MKKLPVILLLLLFLAETASAQIGVGRNRRTRADEPKDISYLEPQEYEIGGITISGAKALNETALTSLSGLEVGDRIMVPGPEISDAIKKLWKQKILGDIRISYDKIEGDKIFLVIELSEKPRLSRIDINGINSSQETEIEEDLKLIRGQIVDNALINRAKTTVERFFIDKGYLNVEVDIKRDLDTLLQNNVVLNIDVDKKQKVKIKRINFKGNEVFGEKKLEGKMKKTNEKVRFSLVEDLLSRLFKTSPKKAAQFLTRQEKEQTSFQGAKAYLDEHVKLNFFNGSKFIKDEYETDKLALIDFYNSKGYRDATIVSDSVYRSGENTINVDLTIDEGQRYYFRDIIWTGNYIYDSETLSRVLGIEKGDVYDLENLNKRLNFNPNGNDVSALYMDNGYLFFNVNPVEVSIEDDSIDVEMRIFEGEQATISNIIISGNDRTNDHVIRREIRTIPGQKFSRSLLIRTQRELSQLGYFDPEQIGINPIPNPADGTVDIEYKLVERPSDQIELSGGWGGAFGFVGTLGLVFNNFSVRNIPHFDRWRPLPVGDGQKLSLRMQSSGRVFQSYSATFSEPWLGGRKPNNLTIGISRQVNNPGAARFNLGRGIDRSLKITNASIGLGRRVRWPDDFFTVSNTLMYRNYDLFNFSLGNAALSNGIFNNIMLSNVISRNSIDNPMFPRAGSSVTLEASFTPPYSLFEQKDFSNMEPSERYRFVEYHRWMFDANFYTPLAKNLVLNANMHMGFFGSYGNGINTPFERFTMGGAGMAGQQFIIAQELIGLRGYPDNQIEPIDPVTGLTGGIAYNKYSMELRYLISPNPSATIYVLGFVEGGNNFASYNKYNPFNLYKSAGVGARIFMPAFGLLGIDWGYGFDELTLPNGSIRPPGPEFHFRIGQQIR